MKKKLIALLTTLALITLMCTPVLAATTNTYDKNDSTGQMQVKATVETEYTVKLPALLELSKKAGTEHTYEGDYTITVEGNINKGFAVQVNPPIYGLDGIMYNTNTPSEKINITMDNMNNTSIDTHLWHNSATCEKVGHAAIGSTAHGHVEIDLIEPGTYEGNMSFGFSYTADN